MNTFDYQSGYNKQNIYDDPSRKSPKKEEREDKITEELKQSTQDLPMDAEEVGCRSERVKQWGVWTDQPLPIQYFYLPGT